MCGVTVATILVLWLLGCCCLWSILSQQPFPHPSSMKMISQSVISGSFRHARGCWKKQQSVMFHLRLGYTGVTPTRVWKKSTYSYPLVLSNTLIKASFKLQTELTPAPVTFVQLTLTPGTKSQRRWCEMSSCWADLQAVGKCHDEMSAQSVRGLQNTPNSCEIRLKVNLVSLAGRE